MATRYYTEEAYEQIKATIETIQRTDVAGPVDFFSDLWTKLIQYLKFLKIDNYQSDMQSWYDKVLDSHNTTLSKVDAIFTAVEAVDFQYRDTIGQVHDSIVDFRSTVNTLRDVVSGKTSLTDGRLSANSYIASGKASLQSAAGAILNKLESQVLFNASKELFGDALSIGGSWAKICGSLCSGDLAGAVTGAKKFIDAAVASLNDLGSIASIVVIPIVGTAGALTGMDYGHYLDWRFQMLSGADKYRNTDCISDILQGIEQEITEEISVSNWHQYGCMGDYNSKVTDEELLKLTILAYEADDVSGNRAEKYAELLRRDLPEHDPLKKVTADQITYIHNNANGFTAFVISDGKSATVIFPGTNGLVGDVVADAKLALGVTSSQAEEAIALINKVTNTHSSVAVTGHSLGGYLATSATLHNEGVNRCVAFDPPGRWTPDFSLDKRFDRSRSSAVTTYENEGSKISWVGFGVGEVKKVRLDNGGFWQHSSSEMYRSMHGSEKVENSWSNSELNVPPESQTKDSLLTKPKDADASFNVLSRSAEVARLFERVDRSAAEAYGIR